MTIKKFVVKTYKQIIFLVEDIFKRMPDTLAWN